MGSGQALPSTGSFPLCRTFPLTRRTDLPEAGLGQSPALGLWGATAFFSLHVSRRASPNLGGHSIPDP